MIHHWILGAPYFQTNVFLLHVVNPRPTSNSFRTSAFDITWTQIVAQGKSLHLYAFTYHEVYDICYFPSITRITICKKYFSIFLVELDKPFLKLQEWPTRSENIRNALGGSCHLDLRNSHQAKIANFKTLEPILKAPVRGQPRQPSGDGQIPDLPWQVYPAKIREFCQCFN